MQAIDDYINGNLADAKRRGRKTGRSKVARALLDEYGYSHEQMFVITEWMFNGLDFNRHCDQLHAMDGATR